MPELNLRSFAAVLAAMLVLLPLAAAGGELSAVGVEVIYHDDRRGACTTPVAGLCMLEVEGAGDPGDATVDVHQEIRSIALRSDRRAMPPMAAHLLPDASLVLHADTLYLEHPVLRLATEAYNAALPTHPAQESAGLRMTPRLVEIYYVGPSVWDPLAGSGRNHVGIEYTSGIEYEQVGPYNAPAGGTTDGFVLSLPQVVCDRGVAESECAQVSSATTLAILSLTPNVRGGVQVYDVEVETHGGRGHARIDGAASGLLVPLPKRAPAPYAPAARAPAPAPLADPAPEAAPDAPSQAAPAPETAVEPPVGTTTVSGRTTGEPLVAPVVLVTAGVAFGVLLAALYSRLARSALFDQEKRSRIYERIAASPGTSVSILRRELNIGRTTIRHHVHVLAQHGLIAKRRAGRETLLFPLAVPADGASAAMLGRSEARQKVAAALVAGAATQRDIQDATGLSQRLVSYHLEHMRRAGFVQEAPSWPRTYAPTPTLRSIVPGPGPQGRVQGATS